MLASEIARKKQHKTATLKKLVADAHEKNWRVAPLHSCSESKFARLPKLKRQPKPASYFLGSKYGSTIIDPYTSGNIKENLLERDLFDATDPPPDYEIFKQNARRPHLSVTEVDILQRIVVRENLLIELEKLIREIESDLYAESTNEYDTFVPPASFTVITELLNTLRECTVDIIECITAWRTLQVDRNAEFLFRGKVYLEKIVSDLNYLDSIPTLTEEIGFEFTSNPFAFPGGGALIQPELHDSSINNYFTVGLGVSGIEVYRLRNCEREMQKCLSRLSITRTINEPNISNSPPDTAHTATSNLKVFDPYAYHGENDWDLQLDSHHDSHTTRQLAASPSTTTNRHVDHIGTRTEASKETRLFKLRFTECSVLKERIENLKSDRAAILRTEAGIIHAIDSLKRTRFGLNKQRRKLAKADIGVLTMSMEVVAQHVLVQESILAGDVQSINAKISDLELQRDQWASERRRKRLLCQRLEDEYQSDSRRLQLQERVRKQMNTRGMVATLELLSGNATRTKRLLAAGTVTHQLVSSKSSVLSDAASISQKKPKSKLTKMKQLSSRSLSLTVDSARSEIDDVADIEEVSHRTNNDIDESMSIAEIAYVVVTIAVEEAVDSACRAICGYLTNIELPILSQDTSQVAENIVARAIQIGITSVATAARNNNSKIVVCNLISSVEEKDDGNNNYGLAPSDEIDYDALSLIPADDDADEKVMATRDVELIDSKAAIGVDCVEEDESAVPNNEQLDEEAQLPKNDEDQTLVQEDAVYEHPQAPDQATEVFNNEALPGVGYEVSVSAFTMTRGGPVHYCIITIAANNVRWTINKTFPELREFHSIISTSFESVGLDLAFPPPITVLMPTSWHHMERADALTIYFMQLFEGMRFMDSLTNDIILTFVESGKLLRLDLPVDPIHNDDDENENENENRNEEAGVDDREGDGSDV